MYLMNFPDFNDSTVKNKVLDWIVFSQGDIHIGLHNLFYVDYTLAVVSVGRADLTSKVCRQ